jgi:hypothetical protein
MPTRAAAWRGGYPGSRIGSRRVAGRACGQAGKGGTVIFSRGGGKSGRHAAGDPRRSARRAADAVPEEPETDGAEELDADEGPEFGPYDISEAPAGERVDLGSLKIPSVQGVEVRLNLNPDDGVVQQVVLVHEGSALELRVFAAPRSEGIWAEVRAELAASLKKDGATVRETTGDYGTELRARVKTPDGPTDLRFVGVEGPRWMVRAVYQGRAAADPAAAGPLDESLRGLVVDRGRDAMPARDPLPLRVPREVADQARAQAAEQASNAAAQGRVNGATGTPAAGTPGRSGAPRGRRTR